MSTGAPAQVLLRDPAGPLEATFVPSAGMLCSSLRSSSRELLAENSGVRAYAQRGKTMGIPLLYPWANRLAGFGYEAAGRTVRLPSDPGLLTFDGNGLPMHGVIPGRLPWAIAQPPGDHGSSLAASLTWSPELSGLFDVFPFRHDLRYTAQLLRGCLEISVTVHACGPDPVPVSFGFHPYLVAGSTGREGWQVDLPAMRSVQLDERQIPVGQADELPGGRLALGTRAFDDGFCDVAEDARFAVDAGDGPITLEFREGYRFAQVYAPPAGRFICFEPMTAPANALRSGVGLTVLAPGETRTSRFAVEVSGFH